MKIKRLFYLFFCVFLIQANQISAQKPNDGCNNENGNDCFLNATIQALYHTQTLRRFLDNNVKNYDQNSIAIEVKSRLDNMKNKIKIGSAVFREKVTKHPQAASNELDFNHPGSPSNQKDAHEFLQFLLPEIKEKTTHSLKMATELTLNFPEKKIADRILFRFENTPEEKKPTTRKDLIAWFEKTKTDALININMDSIKLQNWNIFFEEQKKHKILQKEFTNIFYIETQSAQSCEKNHTSHTIAQDNILPLPIGVPIKNELGQPILNETGKEKFIFFTTLSECLQKYTENELQTDETVWTCEQCLKLGKKNQQAYKQITFQKIPPIFIISLKRFLYGNLTEKITAPISFPIKNLDMSPYLNKQNAHYDLYAIIIHAGGPGGGHYYAYTKWDGNWWCCDDSNVTKLADGQIDNIANQTEESGGPYILFYEKVDAKNVQILLEEKITQLKNALITLKKSLIKLADRLQETKKNIG